MNKPKGAAAAANPEDMTLSERMQAKFGHKVTKVGPAGHKRAPNDTNIFSELTAMANTLDSDSDEVTYVPKSNATDLTKRRMFATAAQEEQALQM